MGGTIVVLGAFMIISGVVGVMPVEYLVVFVVVVMLSLVIFVNAKMVE